ncbi:MAG: TetR/AcrR family transcriptional regulator [Acidimicrobiales bacterium]
MAGAPKQPGAPKQQRAVETREALLDAALECVAEKGYAATTTIETARRAGVSRGAQLHHFPTKAELLAAAVDRLLERRLGEFRKAFADVPEGANPVEAAIDVLWSMFGGPTFVAFAELWMAARTDPHLASVMVEVSRRFDAESRSIYDELFPVEPGVDPGFRDIGRDFAFALMDGLAFQRLVPSDDHRPVAHYLSALKAIATGLAPPAPTPPAATPRAARKPPTAKDKTPPIKTPPIKETT